MHLDVYHAATTLAIDGLIRTDRKTVEPSTMWSMRPGGFFARLGTKWKRDQESIADAKKISQSAGCSDQGPSWDARVPEMTLKDSAVHQPWKESCEKCEGSLKTSGMSTPHENDRQPEPPSAATQTQEDAQPLGLRSTLHSHPTQAVLSTLFRQKSSRLLFSYYAMEQAVRSTLARRNRLERVQLVEL